MEREIDASYFEELIVFIADESAKPHNKEITNASGKLLTSILDTYQMVVQQFYNIYKITQEPIANVDARQKALDAPITILNGVFGVENVVTTTKSVLNAKITSDFSGLKHGSSPISNADVNKIVAHIKNLIAQDILLRLTLPTPSVTHNLARRLQALGPTNSIDNVLKDAFAKLVPALAAELREVKCKPPTAGGSRRSRKGRRGSRATRRRSSRGSTRRRRF